MKIPLSIKLIYYFFFNKRIWINVQLLKRVIDLFKKSPNKHIQQLYVESCKILSLKQDEKASKKFIFLLVGRKNPDLISEAKWLPKPKFIVKDKEGNAKVIKL